MTQPYDVYTLFSDTPEEATAEILAGTSNSEVARGDFVYRQGDPSTSLYVVEAGRIVVSREVPDGRTHVIDVLSHGGVFGDLSIFDEAPREANAYATENTKLLEISYVPVRKILQEHPHVLWKGTQWLVSRMRVVQDALYDSVFLDVPARTAKALLQIAGAENDFELPIRQEELAGMVGASRERVNKAITLFVKLGWLAREGRSGYKITNREEMENRATV